MHIKPLSTRFSTLLFRSFKKAEAGIFLLKSIQVIKYIYYKFKKYIYYKSFKINTFPHTFVQGATVAEW